MGLLTVIVTSFALFAITSAAPTTNISLLNDKVDRLEHEVSDLVNRLYANMIEPVMGTSSPRFFTHWKSISFPNANHLESFYIRSSGWKSQQQYLVLTSKARSVLSVYKLDSTGASLVQTLDITGVVSSKAIYINNTVYLAVVRCCDEERSRNINSSLYVWNGSQLVFRQNIDSWLAEDVSILYTRNNDVLMSFSVSDAECSTKIYKWNAASRFFELYQKLKVNQTNKLHFFYTTPQQLWLALSSEMSNSYIYKWSGSAFELFQTIPSSDTKDLYPLVAGNNVYLIGAHFAGNAMVYKLNSANKRFEQFQSLMTQKGVAVDCFTIKNEHFMSIATQYDNEGESSRTKSAIYKFDGSTFETFQEIPTVTAASLRAFPTFGGCHILGVVSETSSQISIYKWRDTSPDSMCDHIH